MSTPRDTNSPWNSAALALSAAAVALCSGLFLIFDLEPEAERALAESATLAAPR